MVRPSGRRRHRSARRTGDWRHHDAAVWALPAAGHDSLRYFAFLSVQQYGMAGQVRRDQRHAGARVIRLDTG